MASNFQFQPPKPFSFISKEWQDWYSSYRSFTKLTNICKENEETQIVSLTYHMGTREAEAIMKTFKYGKKTIQDPNDANETVKVDESDKCYEDVLNKFNNHFIPQVNIVNESKVFNTRCQGPKESIDSFVVDLQKLVVSCEYHDEDRMVRDRFIAGVNDPRLQEKLQFQKKITLEQAVEYARRHTMIKQQLQDQHGGSMKSADEISTRGRSRGSHRGRGQSRGRGGRGRGRGQQHDRSSNDTESKCDRCNRWHGQNKKCPASGQRCYQCKKMGHFSSACRSGSRPAQAQEVNAQRDQSGKEVNQVEEESFWLYEFTTIQDRSPPWEVQLPLGGSQVTFKIDTGADISIMGSDSYKKLTDKPPLTPTRVKLMSPGGQVVTQGEFTAHTQYNGNKYNFRIIVAKDRSSNLLSRGVVSEMGLVKRVDSVENKVFGACGLLDTQPVAIHVKDDARPYAVMTARRVPFPIMSKVKDELERLQKHGVIVPMEEPSEWCAPMVPVIKKSGKVRITVDYKQLNKAVKRQQHMLPNLEDVSPSLAGATIFSSLDAASGYYQIPLDESSSRITTFMTPFGRYRFRRIPMGITMAPEVFQDKMEKLLENHDGCVVIMDDILVYGRSMEEHDARLSKVLHTIEKSGLRLNKEKCSFRETELTYFGHLVGRDGIKPNPDRVKAIVNMSAPKDTTELRRCLGMINYLGRFIPALADTLKPMSELLREDAQWAWGQPQQVAFDKVKEKMCNAATLHYYQPDRETVVSADASSYGLGGVLLQRHSEGLVPIAYCSRTLTSAERRYAQIEKECLASVWACEKYQKYLIGLPEFELRTDHKPLVPLMMSKDLDQGPIRCQRLLIRLMRFNPRVVHVPGKDLVIADTLSRSPIAHTAEDEMMVEEVEEYLQSAAACLPTSTTQLEVIKAETARDTVLQQVAKYITEGWPESVSFPMKPYLQVRGEMSVADGLVLRGQRITIPHKLQRDILEKIHEGHQGKNKCRERANSAVWWPGIGQDINAIIEACQFCIEHKPAQRQEPLKPTPLPLRPWEKIGCDLCEYEKRQYLITYDYYSRWIDIKWLRSTTSAAVIGKLKELFSTHGIPAQVHSDNGPQFVAGEFAEYYGFKHSTSSPYMSQANGGAERGVGIAKKILAQDKPDIAILNYRASAHSATGISPAEALMGRKLKTRLPVLPEVLAPNQPDHEEIKVSDDRAKAQYKRYYDQRHGAQPLSHLQPGQAVLMKLPNDKGWGTTGKVVLADKENRSYHVDTPRGVVRRNRLHLQPTPACTNTQDTTPQVVQTPAIPVPQPTPAPPRPQTAVTGTPGPRRSSRNIVKPARYRD